MPAAVRVQLGGSLAERESAGLDVAALRRLLGRAARATIRHHGIADAELSITLLADDDIARLNREWLAHDGPTDVISFPLGDDDGTTVGDIYVGFHQAERQAADNDVTLDEELVRLTVHGTLHVLGYDHGDGDDRFDSDMWRTQEHIVGRLVRG